MIGRGPLVAAPSAPMDASQLVVFSCQRETIWLKVLLPHSLQFTLTPLNFHSSFQDLVQNFAKSVTIETKNILTGMLDAELTIYAFRISSSTINYS